MAKYAENTTVSVDRSKMEIESILKRYGATSFMYAWSGNVSIVVFEIGSRRFKFKVPMPERNSPEFTRTPTGKPRAYSQAETEYEKATRQRWRAVALVIKAKLEAVEAGISTLEDEFLYGTMLPSGQTVGEWIQPQIKHVYETGRDE